MITEPQGRVVYEGFVDGYPSLDWRMAAIVALQYERLLPANIWDTYREQVIQYIIGNGHTYCRWKDLFPNSDESK